LNERHLSQDLRHGVKWRHAGCDFAERYKDQLMNGKMIYILDDNKYVLNSLGVLLKALCFEVRTFSSSEPFLSACDEALPYGALIDVRMPGINGLELLTIIRQRQWTFKIVIMTGHGDIDMAVKAMKLGADDFLQKPFAPEQILGAFSSVLSTNLKFSNLGFSDSSAISPRSDDRLAILSPREREVLKLVKQGLSSKEIASQLQISSATVNNHRTQIRDKLNAKSLAHLLTMVKET
jgi:two-component system response regulator FixJ